LGFSGHFLLHCILGEFRVIIRALDRLEEWLIAGLIAAATLIIFFAVGHRYGTGLAIDGRIARSQWDRCDF
jgi:hypothetical protein